MNINTNISTVNPGTVNAAMNAGEAQEVGATGLGAGILGGENLTVTNAAQTAPAVKIAAPVLDEPDTTNDELSQKIIDNISEAADKAMAELKEQLKAAQTKSVETVAVGSSDSTMVDVYQVMNLLLQIASKQRQVARTQRAADLQNSVAAIKSSAAATRSAALIGMFTSIGFSAISLGMQLASVVKTSNAQSKLTQAKVDSGLAQLTQVSKLASGAITGSDSANQANTLGAKLSETELTKANEHLSDLAGYKGVVDAKANSLEAVKSELTATKTELAKIKGELAKINLQALDVQGKKDAVNVPDLEIGGRKTVNMLAGKGGNEGGPVNVKDTQPELKAAAGVLQAKVDKLTVMVENAEADLKAAKDTYTAKLDEHLTGLTADKSNKLSDGAQYEFAKNLEMRHAAGLGDTVKEYRRSSAERQNVVANELELNDDFLKATTMKDKWQALAGMSQTIGQMFGSVGQTVGQMLGTESTEHDSQAKQEEYQKQESDELVQSAKSLMDNVIQMLQQVNQMQNQSITRAIGA